MINFSQTGAVRGSFHWKNFKWKKTWGYGVNFWENKNLYLELNERAEAAISSFSVPGDFYNIFILCLWLGIKRSSDQGVQVMNFPSQIFLTILIRVNEQLYWRKIICGCFHFIWLWLLISVMKRCAERCALQLYHTS